MTALRREPVRRVRPFCWHRWQDVDGMVGMFGLASQCSRCNLVKVFHALVGMESRGSHEMLVQS